MADSLKKFAKEPKDTSNISKSVDATKQARMNDTEANHSNMRCSDIFTEWRRCISAFHQFHQYYIYGELSDCKEEKNRMYNCWKWKGLHKESARVALIDSLVMEQRNMHSPNTPWKLRDFPPDDWKG